jgi:hypothetical protein
MHRTLAVTIALALIAVFPVRTAFAAASNAGEVELTREGKASIDQALQFLANSQRADGSFTGEMGNTTGIVAAGVMAWMCAGNLPGEGPYGKNVAKGVDYILSCANNDGLLNKKGADDGHAMYHHGLAMLCLSEAYGQTRDKRIGSILKKASDLEVRVQNTNGGWHYRPGMQSHDLSVVVMQTMALRAARDAGVAVPKETIDRALACVESLRTPKDSEGLSGFSYSGGNEPGFAMTAAGVASLLFCGDYKASALKEPLDWLMRGRQRKEDAKSMWPYAHYYGMICMYRAGGQGGKFLEYWKKWYPDVSKEVITKQVKTGANRGQFPLGNGIWSTGMCVLMLGVPYRYLPIYQR